MLVTLPIREVLPATPRARIVRFDLGGRSFDYAAGQAVLVATAGVAKRRPYSIAAAPEDARRDGALLALRSELAEQQKSPDLSELLRTRAEGCIEASERGHLKFRAAMLLQERYERSAALDLLAIDALMTFGFEHAGTTSTPSAGASSSNQCWDAATNSVKQQAPGSSASGSSSTGSSTAGSSSTGATALNSHSFLACFISTQRKAFSNWPK